MLDPDPYQFEYGSVPLHFCSAFKRFIRSVSIPDNYSPSRPAAAASDGETAPAVPPTPGRGPEQDTLDLAKTYFDLKEYDRAAFFANGIQSPAGESF
jgi:hypothetical protein